MKTSSYRIKLTTSGPLHIGNGNQYGKRDYFLNNKKVAILDAPRFVAKLSKEQLKAYCDFLEVSTSEIGLHEFLEGHHLFNTAVESIAYQIDAKLTKTKRGTLKYLDVFEFVKDPYGCPCVPGSSFKGMLRTVLLSKIIASDERSFLNEYPKGSSWYKDKNAGKDIEKKALYLEQPDPMDTELMNDVMRFVSVSDSMPLSANALVFVQKYDRFSRRDDASHKRRMGNQSIGAMEEGNELNIYRECLKPGTEIELMLNIDNRIHNYIPLDIEEMSNAFELFATRYKECFLDHFDDEPAAVSSSNNTSSSDSRCIYVGASGFRCRNAVIEKSQYCNLHKNEAAVAASNHSATGLTCYLGGGVDYNSKTLINALFKNDAKRLFETSHILAGQFPTKVKPGEHLDLKQNVEDAGFFVKTVNYRGKQKKEDHRHWKDQQLGVSPHTLKLGKIGNAFLPMGKCALNIERID